MIKKTTADTWFSKCIRERTNWTCEYCDVNYGDNKGSLHCSHYQGRATLSVRYNIYNAFAHCYKCHSILGGDRFRSGSPAEFTHHYDSVFGDEHREIVRQLSQQQFRKHKMHIPLIGKHYRLEFRRMESLRADGETGRIEFSQYMGDQDICDSEAEIWKSLKDKYDK